MMKKILSAAALTAICATAFVGCGSESNVLATVKLEDGGKAIFYIDGTFEANYGGRNYSGTYIDDSLYCGWYDCEVTSPYYDQVFITTDGEWV